MLNGIIRKNDKLSELNCWQFLVNILSTLAYLKMVLLKQLNLILINLHGSCLQ